MFVHICGWGLTMLYLKVHDVTFGPDTHVPHVCFCKQQQPLACYVVFLKQVCIRLHATCTVP